MTARSHWAARCGLHPFAWPSLWLGVWLFGWALCIALSLMHDPPMPDDIPDIDKVFHALAYALLSAWAMLIFARPRARGAAALALIALGWAMELAQGEWTTWRSMDAWDGVADTFGVLLGPLVTWGALRGGALALDRRLFDGRRSETGRG